MSYQTLTVNDVEASQVGLNDIITATGISDGEILTKAATNWDGSLITHDPNVVSNIRVSSHGGNSSYTYDVGDNFCWRKVSGEFDLVENISFVAPSGSYVPAGLSGNGSWTMGLSLNGTAYNGKKCLLYAMLAPYRFSGSSSVFQWGIGTGALSSWTPLGPRAYADDTYGAPCFGFYEGTGTTETLTLKCRAVSGNVAITTSAIAAVQQVSIKILEE